MHERYLELYDAEAEKNSCWCDRCASYHGSIHCPPEPDEDECECGRHRGECARAAGAPYCMDLEDYEEKRDKGYSDGQIKAILTGRAH